MSTPPRDPPFAASTIPRLRSYTIRGNYPNTYSRHADRHPSASRLPGFRPPVVEIRDEDGRRHTVEVRNHDIPLLNQPHEAAGRRYLHALLRARTGDGEARRQVERWLDPVRQREIRFCDALRLEEDRFVLPSFTRAECRREHVSHKGANLVALSRKGYPVPDFCILTAENHPLSGEERIRHLGRGLENLERMTGRAVGSPRLPLIFAMRFAMPEYIPGLMPTYLNVGVTRDAYDRLRDIYGHEAASKMFLNNLRNLASLLDPDALAVPLDVQTRRVAPEELDRAIEQVSEELSRTEPALLTDAFLQARFVVEHTHRFFEENADLIFTFTKGRRFLPSVILQQMICTVRGEGSYPGVLYSRNPRTGRTMVVESVRNIFGEEIMTGTVQTESDEFSNRDEIREDFPAIYHFVPSLRDLERDYASSVTAEFAAESVRRGNFFALLQINASEMTGRATLVSAMDMVEEGIIPPREVPRIVRPYHLRQIVSDTIDQRSMDDLAFFSYGFSILPRTAVSARLYLSASSALEAKRRRNERVCFCKERFVPSDTVVMGEMDIILSLAPAAIHVVTACRGLGIPAFLNLESFGVRLEQGRLVNTAGDRIEEGEWITVSSRRRTIYKGRARFTPARFQQYLEGEPVDLEEREAEVFETMQHAFEAYTELVQSLEVDQIRSLNELIKLIRTDLREDPELASRMVNHWFDSYTAYYTEAVLSAELGTHQEQLEVYNLLTTERRAELHRRMIRICRDERRRGLTAGSFMIGRFVGIEHPVAFWNLLGDGEVAFVLEEWVLFTKYLQVLDDVGEQRINRARQMILDQKLGSLGLGPTDARLFMSLKLSRRRLDRIEEALGEGTSPETRTLVRMLSEPFGYFYDYSKPWSRGRLERLCEREGLPVPPAHATSLSDPDPR